MVWIGSMKFSQTTLCPNWNLDWGKNTFTYLGIDFNTDLTKMQKSNFEKKFIEIKSLLKQWSKRNLTPIGRITVIKTFALPKLVHLFTALPNPDEKYIKQINDTFFNFIWQKPIGTIKRETLIKDYLKGGLKMTNLTAFIDSLKAAWIRRVIQSDKLRDHLNSLGIDFEKLILTGINKIEQCAQSCTNMFWKNVFSAWKRVLEKEHKYSWDHVLKTPLWYNKNIKIDYRPVFYKDWYQKGIHIIADLLNENGEMLSFEDVCRKYNLDVEMMKFNGIVSSVNKYLKLFTKNEHTANSMIYPYIPQNIEIFIKHEKGIKDFYKVLNSNHSIPTNKEKIMKKFEITESEMNKIYKLPFVVTKNTKLQWFQCKINHFVLTTNSFLTKIKLIESPLCNLCRKETETIIHLLWECEKVQTLLEEIDHWTSSIGTFTLNYNKKTFLLGIIDSRYSADTNLVILTIKHYIYSCRCLSKNITFSGVRQTLKNLYLTEMAIATKNQKLEQFQIIWNKWHIMFTE